MEAELNKLLEPVLDHCVNEFVKIKEGLLSQRRLLNKEILDAQDQVKNLKEQEKENSAKFKFNLDKLEEEKNKLRMLQDNLQKELDKTTQLNNEIYIQQIKIKETLANAEGERDISLNERRKQEEKTKEFQDKINSLKDDFEKLKIGQDNLLKSENDLKSRNRELDKREEKIIQTEHGFDERELDIRTKEKRIILEYKRLKLNE